MQHKAPAISERLRSAWRRLRGITSDPLVALMAPLVSVPRVASTANAETSSATAKLSGPLALALQGGGAHGAFTWGVLDRLLEEPGIRLEAASGASAGALNAAMLAAGYLDGGPEGARARLKAFWDKVTRLARLSPLQPTPFERLTPGWNPEWSFPTMALDLLLRFAAPYQLNPLGLNPLCEILVELIDFERLRRPEAIRLFVAATNVVTSEVRIFTNAELSPEVLLASACLPAVQQAVRLDDGYYWDGGFSANPPLLPLVEHCEADDILLVRLNPAREEGVPVDPHTIRSRLNHIAFESPLKRELDSLAWLRRMAAESGSKGSRLARRLASLRLHTIAEDEVMQKLGSASKLYPDERLVRYLETVGREAAERWLAPFAAKKALPACPERNTLDRAG